MSAAGRHAVYFAPAADSPWWGFGAHWLGRDAFTGAALDPSSPPNWTGEAFAAVTREPRRYGWHATLKAPFRAAVSEDELRTRLDALAHTLRPIPLQPLVPVWVEDVPDGFLALMPADPSPALNALAARCVTALDDLRCPPTSTELARRQPERLDARGRELLKLHGYPYVMERFRFHMTLTGPCDAQVASELMAYLAPQIARLNADSPPVLDRLCLFHEAAPGSDFVRVHDAVLPA
jgi:putative phosphonate metabolism protein